MNREEKFKRTVDENKEKIMRICRYYAPSAEDQKDMYQEVLINIWRSLDSFLGDSKVSTWVYRIAVNTSLSYAGKHYKLMKLNVNIENTNIKNLLSAEFNDNMLKDDHFQRLQTYLNQLSVIDKAIMGLVLDELTSKEIADIIGITEPNVRIKIHRIKENLRNQMKGENYE